MLVVAGLVSSTRPTPNYMHTLTATDGLSDQFNAIPKITFKQNLVDSRCNILYRYTHNIDILALNDDIIKCELNTNHKTALIRIM